MQEVSEKVELYDYEQKELERFKQVQNPTEKEINEFIKILLALRERPYNNPLLKKRGKAVKK